MALTLNGTSGITGAGIGTIGPSGANITGVVTCTSAGIGTNGPVMKMQLHEASSGNNYIKFTNDTTGSAETDGVHLGLGSDEAFNINQRESNDIRLFTTATERLRVASDGTVTVKSEDLVFETTGKGLEFQNSVTVKEASSNLNINVGAGNNNVEILSNGTAFVKLRGTNGNVELVDGNVVLSTAGKGIDFSATASNGTSELLDDYEEGTFTITVTPGSGSYAVSHMQAHYVKVGHICHIQGWWRCASVSSASGGLILSGFPFTTFNNTGSGGLRQQINVNIAYAASTSDHIAQLRLADNHTNMEILSLDNVSDTYYTWTSGNIQGATAIYMRGSYVTSS